MKICFLYGNDRALLLAEWLRAEGHVVVICSEKLTTLSVFACDFDLLVSFTYRYYIPKEIVDDVHGQAVNLHISYFPWNRGADPNLWSWIDNTPKGVTIHFVSEIIDDGDIIAQKITPMEDSETLRTSYDKLMLDVMELFKQVFQVIPYWKQMRKRARSEGSYHYSRELDAVRDSIDFDLPVSKLISQLFGVVK